MASQEAKQNRRSRNSPSNRQVLTRSRIGVQSNNRRKIRVPTFDHLLTRLRSVKARLEICRQRITDLESTDNDIVENLEMSSGSNGSNNNHGDSTANVSNTDASGSGCRRRRSSAAEGSPRSSTSSPGTSGMSSNGHKRSRTFVCRKTVVPRAQYKYDGEKVDRHLRRSIAIARSSGDERIGGSEVSAFPTGNINSRNDNSNNNGASSSFSGSNSIRGSGGFPLPITADLASLFECPVCFGYVIPPILQCQSGHLVCSNCRPKLSSCPTCRRPLGNIRNLAMEKVVSTVRFLCKFTSSGCTMSLNLADKTDHEDMCQFRHYPCPYPHGLCEWRGSFDQVIPHLLVSHKSITKNKIQVEDVVLVISDVNQPGRAEWMLMQPCFGHTFMVILEKHEKSAAYQRFYAILQLIGTRRQAELFTYKLELKSKGRRLTWESTPRSIHDNISSAIASSDCLAFDNSFAKFFIINGKLELNLKISMVDDSM